MGESFDAPQVSPLIAEDAPRSDAHVHEVTERTAFLALEAEWNDLVSSTGGSPFYRHEFFRSWIANFAPASDLLILVLRDAEGRLAAILPLLEKRSRLLGARVLQIESAANDHTPRFDLIAREPAIAAAAFVHHLAGRAAWDVLRLREVPEEGNAWLLAREAAAAGLRVGTWDSIHSPRLVLPETVEEFDRGLPAKFRANLRRRRRNLETRGPVAVERVTGGLDLHAKLEEGYALEESGWKGRAGSAIGQDPITWGFYSELARSAAGAGMLVLFFLRCGGRPIAFQYAIVDGGRYHLLKTAYDEAMSEFGPGQLLVLEAMRDCISRGVREYDFLGPDMPWKREWTSTTRAHSWIFVFGRSPYARLVWRYKFRWARAVKKVLRPWRQSTPTGGSTFPPSLRSGRRCSSGAAT